MAEKHTTLFQAKQIALRTKAEILDLLLNTISIDQGQENAGKFLVVGNDGNITLQTLATWQGGSY